MSKIIVSWSIAYDNIMMTKADLKKNLVLDNDLWFNLSFELYDLKKCIWWSWLNISYNIALLWWDPILLSSIWNDFVFSDFARSNIDLDHVYTSKDKLSANYFIVSDSSWNTVRSFFPWAICDWCNVKFTKKEDIKYAIISSDYIPNMLKNIKMFFDNWYKVFFTPWLQINQLTKDEIDFCINHSHYLLISYAEYSSLKLRWEYNDWELISKFEKILINYWVKWSKIFDNSYNVLEIEWVENPDFVDISWAGDAYIAWLVYAINEWYDWQISAKIWAVLSSISTWYIWAQNHNINWKSFSILFEETFWTNLRNIWKTHYF